jgi:intracellular sulfur oxidation DsrE/DsrF family protein
MSQTSIRVPASRRSFLGRVAAGAAALGMAPFFSPLSKAAELDEAPMPDSSPAELWFNSLKGRHKMVFDVPHQNGLFPFAWPKVFQLTNLATGTPEKDSNVVVVLRHEAIGYAMQNDLWSKYNFGEVFKITDPTTKATATKNPFWMPNPNFSVPGLGEVPIGINQLQEKGVMFCVCDMAMTVYSAAVAGQSKTDPAIIKKEWIAGILPGIQLVPSGVWAIGRAQEHGCAYCFAG